LFYVLFLCFGVYYVLLNVLLYCMCRGFGFITFSSPTSIDKVLTAGMHQLDAKVVGPETIIFFQRCINMCKIIQWYNYGKRVDEPRNLLPYCSRKKWAEVTINRGRM